MCLYIVLYIISLLSFAPKSSSRTPNLALTLSPVLPVPISMALSKPIPDEPNGLDLESIGYDYDTNWDNCDYVDPATLSDKVDAQDLLVIQWNLRGVRGKLDDIEDFLNNTLEQKVGIVIVCETWLNNNSPPLPPIKGYNFVGKPRLDRKGGGVGFIIRKDIVFRRKAELEVDSTVLENMIIEVKGKINILMCSGYRPPNTSTVDFINKYEKVLKNMTNHKYTTSVIGIDHNLDFIKHSMHSPTQLYLTQNLDYHMTPTITRPTRITQTSATLIDNLFISLKLQDNYKSGILINDTSDHLPCYVILLDTTGHKSCLQKYHFVGLPKR